MAASSLELDWTESDLSSSPEPADKNGEKESSKTDEHEVINSALSGPLSASTPKKCREDRYASYTEISFGSEELSRPSVEISFGSEHSEPALIPLDFGQSSGLSSVGSSSTALGNKSVSLDFSYGKLCYVTYIYFTEFKDGKSFTNKAVSKLKLSKMLLSFESAINPN